MSLQGRILDGLAGITTLPPEVEAAARLHLADALGVGLASAGSAVGAPWRAYGAQVARGGPATVLGQAQGASAPDAALVNGGLIHSLEYDDTHTGSVVHGSAVLAAAALAAAEASGVTGAAMLRAYALWYEVLIRLGLAAKGGYQARGFQITSVGGALCAAGIAADLGGLDRARASAAIGIALSQSSGVFEFLTNGASVKSMHPGWAAHAGLTAADLARAGLTGPETALEGRFGLLSVFAGAADAVPALEAMIDDLGTRWHLPDAAFKFYPACHYIHPYAEAAGQIADAGITASDIATLTFRVAPGAAPIICDPWEARQQASGHKARWSLPVCVAIRLATGRLDLESFETSVPDAARALALRSRWEKMEPNAFPDRFEAELTVTLTSGESRSIRIEDVHGNASRPATEAEVMAKFTANVARFGGQVAAPVLHRALEGLTEPDGPGRLAEALRQAAKERDDV